MTEKQMDVGYGWTRIELPKSVEVTAEEAEIYNIVRKKEIDGSVYHLAKAFMTLEAETDKSTILNVAWLAALLYQAGVIRGVQQERERRKGDSAK